MRTIDTLRKYHTWYRKIWKYHYKIDVGLNGRMPFYDKIKYNALGFTVEDYFNLNLKENDYHKYISFQERWRLEKINGCYGDVLGQKLLFERLFGSVVNVPHIYCWSRKGKFFDIYNGSAVRIAEIVQGAKTIIAKPSRSAGGGTGVHKIEYKDKGYWIDGKHLTEEAFFDQVSAYDDYIFTQYIEPGAYSKEIFSETANSIRVVTVINDNEEAELLFAYHRFGCSESVPVDNTSSGGLFCLVDLETGMLGKAKRITEPGNTFTHHPDTGKKIEGVEVPGWDKITAQLKHAHEVFRFFAFFAWDVVVTDDGFWILEINRASDMHFQSIQAMRDEPLGKYMRAHHLLDKR